MKLLPEMLYSLSIQKAYKFDADKDDRVEDRVEIHGPFILQNTAQWNS